MIYDMNGWFLNRYELVVMLSGLAFNWLARMTMDIAWMFIGVALIAFSMWQWANRLDGHVYDIAKRGLFIMRFVSILATIVFAFLFLAEMTGKF